MNLSMACWRHSSKSTPVSRMIGRKSETIFLGSPWFASTSAFLASVPISAIAPLPRMEGTPVRERSRDLAERQEELPPRLVGEPRLDPEGVRLGTHRPPRVAAPGKQIPLLR